MKKIDTLHYWHIFLVKFLWAFFKQHDRIDGLDIAIAKILFPLIAQPLVLPQQQIRRVAGGAFSGKDPSKVDRSAAYAARYVAKNIVAAGLADRCEIQVSYAIGVAEPTSIMVETFGTEKVPSEQLTLLVREFFDLRPYGLIQMLDLLHPIYKETAAYGHFGREHFPWEKTDKAALLREAAGLK